MSLLVSSNTELGILWEQYKKLLDSGSERTEAVLAIEEKIHKIQKEKGWSRYDFDSKWERKRLISTPTVTGGTREQMDNKPPTEDDIPVPVANFTFEQAKQRIGDNDYNILEDIAMHTECLMICLAEIHNKINPENRTNMARRGQAINNDLFAFREKKKQ